MCPRLVQFQRERAVGLPVERFFRRGPWPGSGDVLGASYRRPRAHVLHGTVRTRQPLRCLSSPVGGRPSRTSERRRQDLRVAGRRAGWPKPELRPRTDSTWQLRSNRPRGPGGRGRILDRGERLVSQAGRPPVPQPCRRPPDGFPLVCPSTAPAPRSLPGPRLRRRRTIDAVQIFADTPLAHIGGNSLPMSPY